MLVQLLRNAYKRESKHQSKEELTLKQSKPMQKHFDISLNFLQVHYPFFPDS